VGVDVPVRLHAGARRDELADDDVLLEADERVGPGVDRRLGEHPGGLLEGGRREPRVGGQRRLGDAHELHAAFGGALALFDQELVGIGEGLLVDALPGEEVGVVGLEDGDPTGHLAHDELDVLVVDRHALLAVHLLDLFDEVALRLADAADLEELLGIAGALDQRVAGLDLVAVLHLEPGQAGHRVGVLGAVVADDGDDPALALVLADAHHAGGAGQGGLALGRTSLEELDHAGQAAGDVGARHTTGVEGPHGQLGAGLADGLGGDDADRLADLDGLAGGQGHAVARPRDAGDRVVGERRQDPDPGDGLVVAQVAISGSSTMVPRSMTVPSPSVTSFANVRLKRRVSR
jgi:hypothetical protein